MLERAVLVEKRPQAQTALRRIASRVWLAEIAPLILSTSLRVITKTKGSFECLPLVVDDL